MKWVAATGLNLWHKGMAGCRCRARSCLRMDISGDDFFWVLLQSCRQRHGQVAGPQAAQVVA